MKLVSCVAVLLSLTGCATLGSGESRVGRPVAEAIPALGPPMAVADYHRIGRYFTFSLVHRMVIDEDAGNPANWTEPTTRLNASPPAIEEARYEVLPSVIFSPPYKPPPCTLTLIAQWSERRRAWVVKREIRRGAAPGGRCGIRVFEG